MELLLALLLIPKLIPSSNAELIPFKKEARNFQVSISFELNMSKHLL